MTPARRAADMPPELRETETRMTETCDPPKKYREHQWHWLRHAGECRWYVAECRNGTLWNGPGCLNAVEIYKKGWRYVGPATPPDFDPATNSFTIAGIRP